MSRWECRKKAGTASNFFRGGRQPEKVASKLAFKTSKTLFSGRSIILRI
jgi:hypothetical protein